MLVNPVTANSVSTASKTTSKKELSAEDFWQLLLTHLQMQDPFQTADINGMMEQFVTLQAAREMARLSDTLQRVQALLLLGRVISGDQDGEKLSGMVIGVSLTGSPTLKVKVGDQTFNLPMSAVWEVSFEPSQNFSTEA
ncbi:MAG: hypothetical protein NZ805_01200 [Armatimonadetes bacterium]|nr:hypothetical protein [Armatimonadota bacterium]MDW8027471.1 flagellar hook capping FlgD N-terminal domain-containing protein [Armatimonadota bacterium]